MTRILLVLLALTMPVCVSAGDGLPTLPYLYVEAKAEIEKPADFVTLHFELSAQEADQPTAFKQVQAQAVKVLALLKSMNIADKDTVASDLRSEGVYEGGEGSGRRFGKEIAVLVRRPFSVKVREIATFPKVVEELVGLGVKIFSSIEEGVSNEQELEDQVWEKAVSKARERADRTLKAAGMKVDSIFAISSAPFPDIARRLSQEDSRVRYSIVAAPNVDPLGYRLAPVVVSQSIHVIYLTELTHWRVVKNGGDLARREWNDEQEDARSLHGLPAGERRRAGNSNRPFGASGRKDQS